MANCTDCEFAHTCQTNKMDGVGPEKADIMLVGDFPGWTDDEQGSPFQGDSGQKLNYLLNRAGIRRGRLFVTTAVKCKPPRNAKVKRVHIEACQKHLFQEILEVRPKVIIAMGATALEALTGLKNTGDYRGYFQEFELDYEVEIKKGKKKTKTFKTQVMPTYSCNACLNKWEWDALVEHDMKKAAKFAVTGELPKPPVLNVDVVTDLKTLQRVKDILLATDEFSTDFETTGLQAHIHEIIMAGFCVTPGQAYVIPTFIYTEEHMKKWTQSEKDYALNVLNPFVKKHRPAIMAALKEIMASKARKILHNGKFDSKFARANKYPIKNFKFDTIIAHSLSDENKPHDLAFILEWFGFEYGAYDQILWQYVNKDRKNKKPYSFVPPQILSKYLGVDVDGTRRLKPILRKKLKEEGLFKLFTEQQMPLVNVMADLEYRGIKLDVQKLQKISKDFAAILADIDKQLKKVTKNKTFNPNSPPQLLAYLEDIGAPLEKKTKGGKYSTDKDVLEKMAMMKRFAKVPKLILESRAISKLKGTYLDGKTGDAGMLSWADKNHMVHATWNPFTPRTGRMSCEDPPLQTIPRPNPKYPEANIRQLFIPSLIELVMFSIDYKQLEMRIAAFLSQDPVMMREIREDVDIHTRNIIMFNKRLGLGFPADTTEEQFNEVRKYKPPESWRDMSEGPKKEKIRKLVQLAGEYDELRTLAKSLGFGLNYGIEAQTLANDFSRDVEDIQEMIDLYFEKYQGLFLWREEQKATAIRDGVLILPETGRKRRFYGASDWFRSEYSQDCQKREMDMQGVHRQAMNYPIQGFANEVFTQGKLKFYAALKKEMKGDARMMLSLHDGVLGEGYPKAMARVKELAKATMERTLGSGKKAVHLGVDFDVYDRWSGNKLKVA